VRDGGGGGGGGGGTLDDEAVLEHLDELLPLGEAFLEPAGCTQTREPEKVSRRAGAHFVLESPSSEAQREELVNAEHIGVLHLCTASYQRVNREEGRGSSSLRLHHGRALHHVASE
jgi:hypothetical protein